MKKSLVIISFAFIFLLSVSVVSAGSAVITGYAETVCPACLTVSQYIQGQKCFASCVAGAGEYCPSCNGEGCITQDDPADCTGISTPPPSGSQAPEDDCPTLPEECTDKSACDECELCLINDEGCGYCGTASVSVVGTRAVAVGTAGIPKSIPKTRLGGLFKPRVDRADRSAARFGAAGNCPSRWDVTNAASGGSCCVKPKLLRKAY